MKGSTSCTQGERDVRPVQSAGLDTNRPYGAELGRSQPRPCPAKDRCDLQRRPDGGKLDTDGAAASQIINKRFPDLNVQVEPGAALVNMEKIRTDKADIGWSMTTVMADAQKGEGQFEGKKTDKALYVANFYPNVWQLVVPANSDIKSVKDLKGSRWLCPHAAILASLQAGSICSRSTG
ncbi:MAG: hypothetical protein HC868_10765 [Sphingomonadales bacterium]|nr:hypothetical protein [Sphingomonadales bacterium]